jgi:hypothetical protein
MEFNPTDDLTSTQANLNHLPALIVPPHRGNADPNSLEEELLPLPREPGR